MVKKVAKQFGEPVYMVMGGFHLEGFTDEELDNIIGKLKKAGVKKNNTRTLHRQQSHRSFCRRIW
jgi:metal-dependent hydrolase (beta-lactamase superfamily II)